MSEGKGKGSLREAMPQTASMVDELRMKVGAERVDAALKAGREAEREYRRLEASEGLASAEAWLRRQKWPQGRFWACEAGREVGVRLC